MTWLPDILPGSPAVWLAGLIWTAGVVWMTTTVNGWVRPEPEAPAPDTVTVDRPITKRDTVTQTVVDQVIRYDTVETTDTAFVPVPTDWQPTGLIGSAPLDIGQDEATLTYWDHSGRRFEQKVYDIPEPTWSLAPSVTAEATPDGPVTSAALTLGRRRLSLSAGYEVAADYHGWTVGLTWTPYKLEW